MKRLAFLLLCTAILQINCGSGSDSDVIRTEPILEDVFTLELSFGADNLPDEYLLAQPSGIIVTDKGDIIVADETRLKVFDSSGNPKRIIGRPGEGPGEFIKGMLKPSITESGYLTVLSGQLYGKCSLFAPDYTFLSDENLVNSDLRKILLNEYNGNQMFFNGIYYYSPDERIIHLQVWGSGKQKSNQFHWYWKITYQKDGQLTSIADYENLGEPLHIGGYLLFSLLPDKKIIYTNTRKHKYKEIGSWYYSMFVYDLKNRNQKEIKRKYNPVTIPDAILRRRKIEGFKIYAPLQRIITDNYFIFAVTYEYNEGKGYLVDIFNSSSREYLRSAYFPFIPAVIKNGYAYRLKTGSDIFPEVEKYKVNPAVYGR